jgi:hypothetical protein
MSLQPIQSRKSMPLDMVLLTFMSLVAYVTQHMSHNIINGQCHSLWLGSVIMTYVTKESYVINHYAMKAYVTQYYNITKVIVISTLCKCH